MLGYTNKVYGALIAAENLIAALTAPIAANRIQLSRVSIFNERLISPQNECGS